jgi:hypothetical protein
MENWKGDNKIYSQFSAHVAGFCRMLHVTGHRWKRLALSRQWRPYGASGADQQRRPLRLQVRIGGAPAGAKRKTLVWLR